MKRLVIAMLTLALSVLPATAARAQGDAGASSPAAASHADPLVRMHQQVAAANRTYEQKVAAAQKVFDQKKAAAKKERDAAIKAAHNAAGQ